METIYTRNYRGDWFKNGRFVRQIPSDIRRLASNMAIECRIVVTYCGEENMYFDLPDGSEGLVKHGGDGLNVADKCGIGPNVSGPGASK